MSKIKEIDLRGLKCPLPVLKTRNFMKKMKVNEKIWVWCDDPLSTIDIPNFCKEENHKLIETKKEENESFQFLIEKL